MGKHGKRTLGTFATYGAVVAMAIITIAAVWLATRALVERAAQRELRETYSEVENYARTLAGHVERTLWAVDRSLLAIKRDLERGSRVWSAADLAAEQRVHGAFVSALTLTDARGALLASSIPVPSIGVAAGQHLATLATGQSEFAIGQSVRNAASGSWSMHAARRVNAQDGSFAGAVSADLNLDYFAAFYRGLDLGHGGSVEIIGLDGVQRLGEGTRGTVPGAAAPRALIERIRRGETRGTDSGVTAPDGTSLIRSYYVLEGYPLVVMVAKSQVEALRNLNDYRMHAFIYAAGITLLILALMASTYFLMRRQRGTQAALSGSEARFKALTELTSDWYWETDAEYRFTLMSLGIAHWRTRNPGDYLGKRRWELEFLSPVDGGWERHQETVRARLPFRDLVVRHIDAEGNVGYTSVTGQPVSDASGRHAGYRGA